MANPKISFHGAAGEVTGSRHLLETDAGTLLLDCGMFQGHRGDAQAKNRTFRFPPASVDAVILSHAHVDHCGLLPLLYKEGCDAPLYSTLGTAEITGVMLADSARLQVSDAQFYNKIHAAENLTIEPLYDEDDANKALGHLQPAEYGADFSPLPGVRARFHNAGHVLGSAITQLDLQTEGGPRRLVYTGDLGRQEGLLMETPEVPEGTDYLVIESTYGGRLHEKLSDAGEKLAEVIKRAVKSGGKVIIPSFALERTQEIVFILDRMFREGKVPQVPVYVDSPMAVSLTEIFSKRRDDFSFDDKFRAYARMDGDPFGFDYIRYLRTKEDSQSLNNKKGPMLIISASGMCEGGRVLHHLRNGIGRDENIILLVGYQAMGTLGRKLQEGMKKIKIFGMEHEVAASIETMHVFSSHADNSDLVAFVKAAKPARGVFLVHGEPEARAALTEALTKEGIKNIISPLPGEEFELN
ncbi:MAG: hypothetical protein A2X32_04490 [Elusimicrobia bacterium GWC2_64_44]|nr:MAG: hypothetical protein A2X32_04490 [Elusimicrobia bacterium GWC2_64_44]